MYVKSATSVKKAKKERKRPMHFSSNYMSMTEGFANKALRLDHVSTSKPKITKHGVFAAATDVSGTATELARVQKKQFMHMLRAGMREDPSFGNILSPGKSPKRQSKK